MLKYRLDNLDGIDELIAAQYVEDPDGHGYVLDVEGAADAAKLAEFRTNNNTYKRERDAAMRERDEALKAAKANEAAINDLKTSHGDIDKRLQSIREEMGQAHAQTKAELEKERASREAAVTELNGHRFQAAFDEVALSEKHRIRKAGLRHLRRDAQDLFEYDPEARRFKPRETAIDPQTGDLYTLDSWLVSVRNSADGRIFFEGSEGGGAAGGSGGRGPATFSRSDLATPKLTPEIAAGIGDGSIQLTD